MTGNDVKNTGSRRNLLIGALLALGFLLLVSYGLWGGGHSASSPGKPAPDFTITLLNGETLSLHSLRGQVVVVNFWASWCTYCRDEAPSLERLWQKYRDRGVIFVGIGYREVEEKAWGFIQDTGITFPNGLDPRGNITRAYGVTGVPETYVIDQEGKLRFRHIGPVEAEILAAELEQLLP